MRSILILSVLSLSTLSACEQTVDSTLDSGSDEVQYLGDYTQEEVEAMAANYDLALDEFAAGITAPFDCEAFGDVCESMGAEAGEAIVLDMLAAMADGEDLSQILATLQGQAEQAESDWIAAHPILELDRAELMQKTSDDLYTNAAGYSCYLRAEAKINNWFTWVEHYGSATNYCYSFGVYMISSVPTIKVTLDSKRVYGGVTDTDSGWKSVSSWYTVSKSNYMSPWGTHTAKATAKASGAAVGTSSVSESVSTTSSL